MVNGTSLTDLPNELLRQVFSYHAAESRALLLPVCLTCNRFRELGQSLLIRTITFKHGTTHATRRERNSGQIARYFLQRPDMRTYVKNVIIVSEMTCSFDWKFGRNRIGPLQKFLSLQEMEQLARCAEEAFPQADCLEEWKNQLRAGIEEPLIALIAAWAPRLEFLEFILQNGEKHGAAGGAEELMTLQLADQVTQGMSGCTAPQDLPLHHLRKIHLDCGVAVQGEAWDLAALFYLPSLRIFRTNEVGASPLELYEEDRQSLAVPHKLRPLRPFPDRTSPVEEISVSEWWGGEANLCLVIMACKNLRKLHHFSSGFRNFNSPELLADAISAHSDSLEEVILVNGKDSIADAPPDESLPDDGGKFGAALRSCTNLRVLDINILDIVSDRWQDFGSSAERAEKRLHHVKLQHYLSPSIERLQVVNAQTENLLDVITGGEERHCWRLKELVVTGRLAMVNSFENTSRVI